MTVLRFSPTLRKRNVAHATDDKDVQQMFLSNLGLLRTEYEKKKDGEPTGLSNKAASFFYRRSVLRRLRYGTALASNEHLDVSAQATLANIAVDLSCIARQTSNLILYSATKKMAQNLVRYGSIDALTVAKLRDQFGADIFDPQGFAFLR
jgi:hypothetical protein